ncbi:ABC transporter substrate-binding protein [Candidatus Kaiserbacteria bacterium]|nr:ABC transporter substrate-binding protein [Candidatus Kaiserbacteria bacterium]
MSKEVKWITGIIIVLIIIAILAFNNFSSEPSSENPIKIGGIFALTGIGAAIGEEELKGAELAIAEINRNGGVLGREIQFIPEDLSLDKMKNAGTIAQKLINIDKVVGIIGPQWDEPAIAILPLIEEHGVPTIGADITDTVETDGLGENLFSTWYDNRVGILELLRFAQARDITNIAVLRLTNGGFWKFTADYITKQAPQYGVAITDDIDFGNPLSLDFRTSIAKINQKNPQAIFVVVSDYNQCAFIKQAKEIGFNGLVLSTESAGSKAVLGQCPEALEDLYFSTPVNNTEEYEDFEKLFFEKYERKSLFPSAVTSYDAVRVLVDAIERAGNTDRATIREELAKTRSFKGASLPEITFNEKGFVITPEDAFQMVVVRSGGFVKVEY